MGSPEWTVRDRERELSSQQKQGHEDTGGASAASGCGSQERSKWQGQVEGEGRPHTACSTWHGWVLPDRVQKPVTKSSPGQPLDFHLSLTSSECMCYCSLTLTAMSKLHTLPRPRFQATCPASRSLLPHYILNTVLPPAPVLPCSHEAQPVCS